jgi:hypothetical protein
LEKSQKTVTEKIRKAIRGNRSAKQDSLIAQLNPIVSGWSTYHQGTVAKEVFSGIDNEAYTSSTRAANSLCTCQDIVCDAVPVKNFGGFDDLQKCPASGNSTPVFIMNFTGSAHR